MKAKAGALLLSICLAFGITGCSALQGSLSNGASVTEAKSAISDNDRSLAEKVFNKDKVVDVEITINPDDFQNMLDNASEEQYNTASVEYNGQKFDNVAVRTKGNLSLRSVVNSDSDRYSIKIAFDEYISSQNLFGVTKINLNNGYSDASYMRELLTYELAESIGLPTPLYSFVNVYVNGELKGFYLAVEQIGDSYLKRHFSSTYGALYKANGGTGSELTYLETIESYIGLDLKSGAKDGNALLEMLKELNTGTDYEKVLDVDEVLKFIALNAVTGNMDSYLGSNKHNYYLYEDKGVFSILPWDYNMAFGGLGGSNILIDEPTQGTLADRPLVDKLLKVDAYKQRYHDIISEMIKGYLAKDVFSARVQQIADLISPYVEKDPSAFYTYDQYTQALAQLAAFNSQQIDSITKQLDGTSPSAGNGSGSGGGMGGGRQGGGNRGNAQVQIQAAVGGQGNQNAPVVPNGQNGQAAPNGQNGQVAPNAQNGQVAPSGQMIPGGGFEGRGGLEGRPGGGFGPGGQGNGAGPTGQGIQQGSTKEAITSGGALLLLLFSCLVIVFYKRKRL
ncbi:MAG: spore coat protein CotH [Paenibacillus sp.]|jgi:spore coat protein CotH|nr:spore coat protein CotH [Paenibacillus sp.]